jgi:predicted RNA-binding protein
MCEAHAYILENGEEKKILENVDVVEFEGDQAKLVSIFGEQMIIKGRLKIYDNTKSKIVFVPFEES